MLPHRREWAEWAAARRSLDSWRRPILGWSSQEKRRQPMRTTLVSIPTSTKPLDGAYYEPEGRKPVGAALLFHGNTMNFYYGPPRFLPPHLTKLGLACLA